VKKSPPRQLANLSHKGSGALSASWRSVGSGDSAEATTFHISFEKATPPSRSYSAELAAIQVRNSDVFFIFGQRALVGDELETAISLRMHAAHAQEFLQSIESMSRPGLAAIAVMFRLTGDSLEEIKNNPKKQLAKLDANIVQASVSGFDTTLDFYQLTAHSIMQSKQLAQGKVNDVDMTPIVRVGLRTDLFISLVARLKEIALSFPDFKPELSQNEYL
jgi:hypothetical protein